MGRADGFLAQSPGSAFEDRIYFCSRGRRHYVANVDWLLESGFKWPDDVTTVPESVLAEFDPGFSLWRTWNDDDWQHPERVKTALGMRGLIGSRLNGRGVEIGAFTCAMQLPLDADVEYADEYSFDGHMSSGGYSDGDKTNIVKAKIITSINDLRPIENGSIDFFIACHVIEHTPDPIGAIVRVCSKLKPGGKIALVVPDKNKTFDRGRPTTSLHHLIDDYRSPDPARDAEHFAEFYKIAFPPKPEEYERVWRSEWERRTSIHYHAWDFPAFSNLIDWVAGNDLSFCEIWAHPVLASDESNEFYFLLTKA
jgi:hypothetical protein